jgi:hypothetical protein
VFQLSNGHIDTYQMNQTKSLKESTWKLNQPIAMWNNAEKQLEYYRRFIQDNRTNEIMISDQLMDLKSNEREYNELMNTLVEAVFVLLVKYDRQEFLFSTFADNSWRPKSTVKYAC